MEPQLISTTESVDPVFFYILGVSILLLLGVTGTMIYFAVKYNRRRHPHPTSERSKHIPLEIAWTVIPTLIALSMFWYGWKGYLGLQGVPENAMDITVTGRMWTWSFEYPNGKISDRMIVPVGQPVRAAIHSADVLHSFYVPAFRVKKDAVPGMETFVWFVATEPGSYDIFCAEYCGVGHSSMITTVEALPKEEFLAWYEKEEEAPEQEGVRLLEKHGCLGCHSLDGSPGVGPTLKDLAGRQSTVVTNGRERTVTADEDYIRTSILQPQADLVKGYPPVMPSYEGQIPEGELGTMVDFLVGKRTEEEAKGESTALEILLKKGCVGCHSTDGAPMVGPTFKGLYGRKVTVERNGKEVSLTADADYLRRAILEPQAEIVQGYPPAMPPTQLTNEEMEILLSYLKGLK